MTRTRFIICVILSLILGWLFLGKAHAAAITRFINPDSTGGDGTTPALSGANAAYRSILTWQQGETTKNLVAATSSETVNCAGVEPDTMTVTISGWTTSATYPLAFVGNNTTGKWDDTKYKHTGTAASGLAVNNQYTEFYGMQMKTPLNVTNARILVYKTLGVVFKNCIVCALGGSAGNNPKGFHFSTDVADGVTKVINCVIFSSGSNVELLTADGDAGRQVAVMNCTLSGGVTGIKNTTCVMIASNCAVFNNSTSDFSGVIASSDYCATDDFVGTHPVDISPGADEPTEWAKAFTDYSKGDFTVKGTDSVLYSSGTPLPDFSTDIIGTTRPQSTYWGIGAFVYISGAAPDTWKPKTRHVYGGILD